MLFASSGILRLNGLRLGREGWQMLNWLKKLGGHGEAVSTEQHLSEQLAARIENRFPSSVLFRIPALVAERTNSRKFLDRPDDPRWISMLERYPKPPQTERERSEREAQFWGASMQHFVRRESDGSPGLAPRGEIQELFQNNERWVFRWYYAATGEIIETCTNEMSRLLMRSFEEKESIEEYDAKVDAEDKKFFKSDVSRKFYFDTAREYSRKFGQYNDRLEAFISQTQPAHFEKWGGWFRNGIENAFQREFVKNEPKKNIYGEGGFASLNDILRGQHSGMQTTNRAQAQTFKD